MRAAPPPSPCKADYQVEADVELDGVREQHPARDHAEGGPPDLTPDDEVRNLDPVRLVHTAVPQGGIEVLGLGDAADRKRPFGAHLLSKGVNVLDRPVASGFRTTLWIALATTRRVSVIGGSRF